MNQRGYVSGYLVAVGLQRDIQVRLMFYERVQYTELGKYHHFLASATFVHAL
jgi:hypothetical protein